MRRSFLALFCLLMLALISASSAFAAQPKARRPPDPKAVPTAGDTWREPVTGMVFVWVPEGAKSLTGGLPLRRGSCDWDEDCGWLDGFWLGKFEVTQGQWRALMGENPAHFQKGDDFPVERVSWPDVLRFVDKLNAMGAARFGLPRVAQWRQAANFTDRLQGYAGGDDPGPLAWHKANSGGVTHKVGTKTANGLGIHDMHGNVAEWCDPGSGIIPPALAAELPPPASPMEQPAEPRTPVLGGSWDDPPQDIHALRLEPAAPEHRQNTLGFRLLRLP